MPLGRPPVEPRGDGQGGEVGVGHQGRSEHAGFAKARQDAEVTWAWLEEQHRRLIQPGWS